MHTHSVHPGFPREHWRERIDGNDSAFVGCEGKAERDPPFARSGALMGPVAMDFRAADFRKADFDQRLDASRRLGM